MRDFCNRSDARQLRLMCTFEACGLFFRKVLIGFLAKIFYVNSVLRKQCGDKIGQGDILYLCLNGILFLYASRWWNKMRTSLVLKLQHWVCLRKEFVYSNAQAGGGDTCGCTDPRASNWFMVAAYGCSDAWRNWLESMGNSFPYSESKKCCKAYSGGHFDREFASTAAALLRRVVPGLRWRRFVDNVKMLRMMTSGNSDLMQEIRKFHDVHAQVLVIVDYGHTFMYVGIMGDTPYTACFTIKWGAPVSAK